MGKRERVRARKLKKKARERMGMSKKKSAAKNVKRKRQAGASSDGFASVSASASASVKRDSSNFVPFGGGILRGKDTCLVIGDGDFSFSWCIARQYRKCRFSANHLVCTSYDGVDAATKKYGNVATECIQRLKESGFCVQHDVDGTNISAAFPSRKFHNIIFNFPHVGAQRVHENRALLRDFFASARKRLHPGGKVLVTIKICPPYNGWNIEENAARSHLILTNVVSFDAALYYRLGYRHRTTKADAVKLQNVRDSKTFVFQKDPRFDVAV